MELVDSVFPSPVAADMSFRRKMLSEVSVEFRLNINGPLPMLLARKLSFSYPNDLYTSSYTAPSLNL